MNSKAIAAATGAALLLAASASGWGAERTYVATYLEVKSASVTAGAALSRQYVRATRAEAGNVSINAFQEIGRSNRFIVIETWADRAAFADHEKAAHTVEFRQKLSIIHRSPYDKRLTHGFAVDPAPAVGGPSAVYVVTHVDVPGAQREETERVLKQLFQSSHAGPGPVRFDIYQQDDPRTNHFTMFVVWNNRRTFEDYADTPQWLQFRQALAPLLGAPYDERLYRPLGP
jgi:quinol monooxygenase YgiN